MEPIGLRWRWMGVALSTRRRGSDLPALRQKRARDATVLPIPTAAQDFDDFYRAHRDEIGRALVFTLGDVSLGQEAVDEAMARAYQRWDTLAGTESPAGWVYVVGRRWGLSWRRGRTREYKREQLVAEWESTSDPVVGEYVDLMRALAELSTEHRTVVVCRFSLGLSVKETAALLEIGEGTVKSRLSRSLDRMRPMIEVDE